jgi:hypothetical protein
MLLLCTKLHLNSRSPPDLRHLRRAQLLSKPRELCDLEFALYTSNMAYGQFPGVESNFFPEKMQVSTRQQS